MNLPLIAEFPSLPLDAMESLAARLASLLRPGDVVTLAGEVGAGKTSFARALIGAVAAEPCDVVSPTFPLSQSYDVRLRGKAQTLWHLDLYRLKNPEEAEALGLRELAANVVLMEWPGIIERLLPPERLAVTFDFALLQAARSLRFYGNDAWRGRLAPLQ